MLLFFLRLWYSLPMGWRYVLMGVPLLASGVAALSIGEWYPLLIGALGSLILFLLPGPSRSEKQGYHF